MLDDYWTGDPSLENFLLPDTDNQTLHKPSNVKDEVKDEVNEKSKDEPKSPETQEKKKASEFLDMFGINSRKDFLQWSIKNHPDKGGKEEVYKRVSKWVDIVYGEKKTADGRKRKSRRSKKHSHKKKSRRS